MKSIIFGADGQDGYYLSKLLEENGQSVTGIGKAESQNGYDLANYHSISALIKENAPDYIFHFAAVSSVSQDLIIENFNTIAAGTLNILEAVRNFSPYTKVFISGSALQFKNENKPINESIPFEVNDAYSLCRIQSVFTARYYRKLGIKNYIGYFFNHDSPLRSENHMTKKIAAAAKRIGAGSNEKLEIGDLNAIKEYSFAGDIVKAVWLLVNQDDVSEVVIGSGLGYSITDWLDECFSITGKDWKDYVIADKNFVPQYRCLVSDPTLIRSLGWKPSVDFKQLAQMMMQ